MSRNRTPDWPSTSRELLGALPDPQNSEAWLEFDRRYGDVVRAFCQGKGLQPEDAEDVTQQVFAVVYRQIGKFEYDPERGRFRSWLATVTLRSIWKIWKRRGLSREISFDDVQELLQPEGDAWLQDFGAALLEVAITRIQPEFTVEEWTVFRKSWLQTVPYAEIASELQRSMSWVYQAKSRVLKRVRHEIEILQQDIICPPHRDL